MNELELLKLENERLRRRQFLVSRKIIELSPKFPIMREIMDLIAEFELTNPEVCLRKGTGPSQIKKKPYFVTASKNGTTRRLSIPGFWLLEDARKHLASYGYSNVELDEDQEEEGDRA